MSERALRALQDVVDAKEIAPGMMRVSTWSDSYVIDARGEGCNCPDKRYNDAPRCKHEFAAILADSDHLPTPFVIDSSQDEGGHSCEMCSKLPDSMVCINTLDDPEVDA